MSAIFTCLLVGFVGVGLSCLLKREELQTASDADDFLEPGFFGLAGGFRLLFFLMFSIMRLIVVVKKGIDKHAAYKNHVNPHFDALLGFEQAAIQNTLGRCTSIETGRSLDVKSLRLGAIIKLCKQYRAYYADKRLFDGVGQAGRDAAHHDDGSGSGATLAARAAGAVDASASHGGEQQDHTAGTGGAGVYVDGTTGVVAFSLNH